MAEQKIGVRRRLFGVLIVVGLALTLARSTHDEPIPSTTYTADTSSRTLRLEDTSTVLLNKGSAVEVRFTAERRDVELPQGEAFFLVAPDPARPFQVRVGDVLLTVVGTAFSVSRDSDHTDILVTQGRVAVSYGQSQKTEVGAGSGLRIQHDRAFPLDLRADERDTRLSWANPLAEHKIRDVSDIVRTLNQFNDIQLVIEDSRIARIRMDGGIPTLTTPEAFALTLKYVFNIEARTDRGPTGSKVIRLYRPQHR